MFFDLGSMFLESLPPSAEGEIGRSWGRGEPSLQRCEGEAHRVLLVLAHDPEGAVEPLADISGHVLVEDVLVGIEVVGSRVRLAPREEGLSLEGEELLLLEASHDVVERDRHPGACTALEPVPVDELHVFLEVTFLAVVGRCREH